MNTDLQHAVSAAMGQVYDAQQKRLNETMTDLAKTLAEVIAGARQAQTTVMDIERGRLATKEAPAEPASSLQASADWASGHIDPAEFVDQRAKQARRLGQIDDPAFFGPVGGKRSAKKSEAA